MKKVIKTESSHFGKSGKDSVRLVSCKALVGKIFSDRMTFNTALQDTKAKVILQDGSTKGKGAVLGAVAVGKYKGKATVVKLDKATGNDRTDFAVKLLDDCKVNWSNVTSVGSLSK